jgi:hypothetical protein
MLVVEVGHKALSEESKKVTASVETSDAPVIVATKPCASAVQKSPPPSQ